MSAEVVPVEDRRLFNFILVHRDDERALYAADDMDHIRWFASWLNDDVYLDVVIVGHGVKVTSAWQFGSREEPDYESIIAMAEVDWPEKVAALMFERDKLQAQVARSKRAGF